MTIIAEQAQDTRAKRRIDPVFRPDGGPLPHGKPKALPTTKKNKKDQSNTWESRQQRSTPLQAALAYFRCKTTAYSISDASDSVGHVVGRRPTTSQNPVFRRFCVGRCRTLFPVHGRQPLMPAKP